jgi:hypothetical protein
MHFAAQVRDGVLFVWVKQWRVNTKTHSQLAFLSPRLRCRSFILDYVLGGEQSYASRLFSHSSPTIQNMTQRSYELFHL